MKKERDNYKRFNRLSQSSSGGVRKSLAWFFPIDFPLVGVEGSAKGAMRFARGSRRQTPVCLAFFYQLFFAYSLNQAAPNCAICRQAFPVIQSLCIVPKMLQ